MDILNEHTLLPAALAEARRLGIEAEIEAWHAYPRHQSQRVYSPGVGNDTFR